MSTDNGERCETCKAYKQALKPDGELAWVCQRHPPQVIAIPTPVAQGIKVQVMSVSPGVDKGGYCCDWLPSVTS